MKTCARCKIIKSTDEFNICPSRYDGLSTYCTPCNKEYINEHYQKNKATRQQQIYLYKETQKELVRDWLWSYLLEHPCVVCGESDPIVLEFDHLMNKKFHIADAVRGTRPLTAVQKEVSKCQVLCANCHRRKTSSLNNNWKTKRT